MKHLEFNSIAFMQIIGNTVLTVLKNGTVLIKVLEPNTEFGGLICLEGEAVA